MKAWQFVQVVTHGTADKNQKMAPRFFFSIDCKTKRNACVTADRTTATLNFCMASTVRSQAEPNVKSDDIVVIV